MSSTDLPREENKPSLFGQPYIETENPNVGEKKFFGPNSSKPNFFASKIKNLLDSPKSSDEKLATPKQSGSDVSQTEPPKKIPPKTTSKTSSKSSTKKDNVKEIPKKTEKYMPPSKIPRISDENGKTVKKGLTSSKGAKTEEAHGKPSDESAGKKEIKTAKSKPVNGKQPVKQTDDSLKKRPPSVEKAPISRSRPPSEKITEAKKPSSVQGVRPTSRPSATPRVSTAKKEQDSETKKKQRLSTPSTASNESARERKPTPEKAPINIVKDERYNPEPIVDQPEKKEQPTNLEQLEMFEEVKEPPRELSFLERLQQNVKSYFSPRGSEAVRVETTVEAKKKASDGVHRHPSISKGIEKPVKKTHPKMNENVAELEIKNINLEEIANPAPSSSSTTKEVVFKPNQADQTSEHKITRKKSSVKSAAGSSRASSASEGLCDDCRKISEREIQCDCKCRHHSEQITLKKSISSEAFKQRLSRHSDAILREALLSLCTDHCHRRSRPDMIYEHSSRCKMHAARKHSGKLEAKRSGKLGGKGSGKLGELAGAQEKGAEAQKEEEGVEKTASGSTVISKHFVAPDLFKESSHDFLGKNDNEIIDVIEEEEEVEEKKDVKEGKTSTIKNVSSSPDLVKRRIPESASYYFLKAILNDTGEFRVSLARSDTFPQQYLMDAKVEPLEKNTSQELSIDSRKKKSRESDKNDPERRKSKESRKSETERKKPKERSNSETDRRKSKESSKSETDRKKSKGNSSIEPEKRKSGENSKNELERRKSKSRASDTSRKIDILTYKIGRRSVIYWMPKYEVKIEIFDKNPLMDESGYFKVYRVEHDTLSPEDAFKRWTVEKEGSRKISVEGVRKASVEGSRKESLVGNQDPSLSESGKLSPDRSKKVSIDGSRKGSTEGSRKGSTEGSRKGSTEQSRKGSTKSRKLSLTEPRNASLSESRKSSLEEPSKELLLLEPLEPRISVWQSSKLEMVKELNDVPNDSLATEPLLTFQTSSSIGVGNEKSTKRAFSCRKMSCLRIFQAKKAKRTATVPEIVITEPEEEQLVESKRASTSSKGLELNRLKVSGAEISKIPRDSSSDDTRKDKPSKHNLSLRLFGGKRKPQKQLSNESQASKRSEKNFSGPSYTVQHCSIKIDMANMIIPMITEPTLYDFSAKMLKPAKAPKLCLMDDTEKFLQKMEGGEDKLIHKKILHTEEPWHYDLKYTIKKMRPESCPTYHSQRTVVQQIVWPDGKNKAGNNSQKEKSIRRLKKKQLKSRKRKVSSAGAECQKKSSSISVKRAVGTQTLILEYYPIVHVLGAAILGQQKILQVIRKEQWKWCNFSAKIAYGMILEKVKHESITAESTRLKICGKMSMEKIPQAHCIATIITPLRLFEVQKLRFEDVYFEPNYAEEMVTQWENIDIFNRKLNIIERVQLEAMRVPSWFSFNPLDDFSQRKRKVKNETVQKNSQGGSAKSKSSFKKSKVHRPTKEIKGFEVIVSTDRPQQTHGVVPVQKKGDKEDLNQENLVRVRKDE